MTMKNKRQTSMPYQTRLYNYNQEKKKLFQQNPLLTPKERDEAVRKLADKWKI